MVGDSSAELSVRTSDLETRDNPVGTGTDIASVLQALVAFFPAGFFYSGGILTSCTPNFKAPATDLPHSPPYKVLMSQHLIY